MKKIFFIGIVFLACSNLMLAQSGETGFGIKAGISHNTNGDLKDLTNGETYDADAAVGYHVGVFGTIDLPIIYLRPELIYTKTTSEYDGADFEMDRLDVPVLVGIEVIGPLHVFAGPNLQYIFNTELGNLDTTDPKDDLSIGLHAGLGVQLGRFGIDARYARGFSDNEIGIINENVENTPTLQTLDTKAEELIISLSYQF